MKKNITFILSVAAILFVFSPLATAYAAAVFNTSSGDLPTIQVSNYTKNPGCSNCWSTSVNADKGDIVSISIYYHNNSGETASQTKLRAQLPNVSATANFITGEVFADNANAARGTATINVSSKQTLTFIPGSVKWYPNRSTSQSALLFGQNGSEVIGNGLNVGDIAVGWATQGYLTFRVQVSSTDTDPGDQLPTILSYYASAIGQTYANLNASVNTNNSDTRVWFEYGNSQGLGSRTSDRFIGSSGSRSLIDAISNLNPATTYYFRVGAANTYGTTYSAIGNFNTTANNNLPPPIPTPAPGTSNQNGSLPSVFTNYASGINETFATLTGSVDPNNANTTFWFEYGTSQAFGNQTPPRTLQGDTYITVTDLLPNLTADTTYYFRLAANNSFGTSYGTTLTLVTKKQPGGLPTLQNSFATSVGGTFANLNVTVNPNNRDTTVWFEYGTDGIPSQRSTEQSIGSGDTNQYVSIYAYNLLPNTIYSFRGVARNQFGISYTAISNFTTTYQQQVQTVQSTANQPAANTLPPSIIAQNFAALNGTVNPNNSPTNAWFEWGQTTSLGNRTGNQSIGQTSSQSSYSFVISGLQPLTTYYFRAAATNPYGTNYGPNLSFTTQAAAATAPAVTPIISASAPVPVRQQMAIATAFSSANAKTNEAVGYEITYRNRGGSAVQNAVLSVALPAEAAYQSSNSVPSSTENGGQIIRYNLGNISGGTETKILINVKINESPKDGNALFVSVLDYSLQNGSPEAVKDLAELAVGGTFGLASLLELLGLPAWLIYLLFLTGTGVAIYYVFFKKEKALNNLL